MLGGTKDIMSPPVDRDSSPYKHGSCNQVCNDSTGNEQVKASVCRINLAFLPA